MSITVRKYNKSDLKQWDEFVENSNNGTLFHTHKFLSYHPKDRFSDHSLEFYKSEKLVSILPAAEVKSGDTFQLVSHPGASMGSFVIPEDLSFADSLKIVEQLLEYAKANKFNSICLTQPPTIYSRRLSNYIDFALQNNGFQYSKREVSSVLFLEKTIESTLTKFKQTHRTAVRKAERSGVVVKQSCDYKEFYEILSKNLSIRHGVKPTHTIDELLQLKKLFPDKVNLFGAYLEDKMVAGVVNFVASENVILAFYISHDEDYQESRPINLLFYKIFAWAIDHHYSIFDFGIFTVNEEPNMGLARFKENFGATGVFRDTIELNISKCQ